MVAGVEAAVGRKKTEKKEKDRKDKQCIAKQRFTHSHTLNTHNMIKGNAQSDALFSGITESRQRTFNRDNTDIHTHGDSAVATNNFHAQILRVSLTHAIAPQNCNSIHKK